MRKIFLILALLITATLAFAIHALKPTARAGAAYAAKALCSGVFVSGLHPDRVAEEEYEGLDKAFKMLSRRVDIETREVETSMLGLAKAKAVFDDATGCTLTHKGYSRIGNGFSHRPDFLTLPASGRKQDEISMDLNKVMEFGFKENGDFPPLNTRAIVVVKNGEVIAERYADGIGPDTPLKGWSMNKTITGLVIGTFIDSGQLKLDGPAPVTAWADETDPRRAISIRHLMQMQSGLDFDETYADMTSDVVKMLFLEPSASEYAKTSKLAHEPGTHFYYSSGTTNILAAIAADLVEPTGESISEYMWSRLLKPLNIHSAYLEIDQGDDFVGSSYGYMGAHDWARLGLLMLRNGKGPNGRQIISEEWIQFMTEPNQHSNGVYGAQTWLNAGVTEGADWTYSGVPADMFYLSGHDGQYVVVIPSKDMVIVRLGESIYQNTGDHLGQLLRRTLQATDL